MTTLRFSRLLDPQPYQHQDCRRNPHRAANAAGPWPCPVCGHRLDCQGTEHGSRTVHDLWCHHCHAHITLRIPL